VKLTGSQLTDAEKTANVLALLIGKRIKGSATVPQITEGLNY